jgi:hypothetical protein|tara:strand:+ start:5321 stop:5599 length:279 start_codon:yes stop_codon:yes gene_type:complete
LLILSILIEVVFLKKIVKIAKPIAASAAATTKINKEKICPDRSFNKYEKPTKLILADKSISSIDIKMVIIFFLLIKIPKKPIAKTEVDRIRK